MSRSAILSHKATRGALTDNEAGSRGSRPVTGSSRKIAGRRPGSSPGPAKNLRHMWSAVVGPRLDSETMSEFLSFQHYEEDSRSKSKTNRSPI